MSVSTVPGPPPESGLTAAELGGTEPPEVSLIDVSSYRSDDPDFGEAYIDKDEPRQTPVPHRYVHGGFRGNHTRFSFYMPPKAKYQGRLLQYLAGGSGGSEHVIEAAIFGSPWQYAFAFEEMGACLIESNQGHFLLEGMGFKHPLYLYQGSAETARFAKWFCARSYGTAPHHTYVYGESGGGHRTLQCIMHASDVYDGAAPEVVGANAGPTWSVLGYALDRLGDKAPDVIDALEPGGGGNPFAGLDTLQREALADLLRMGYPRQAASQLYRLSVFPFRLYDSEDQDPDYFRRFWREPGHEGFDNPAALADRLIRTEATVRRVVRSDEEAGGLAARMASRLAATGGAASGQPSPRPSTCPTRSGCSWPSSPS